MCVNAHLLACVCDWRACVVRVRACACVHVRACVYMRACACVRVHVCVDGWVFSECVRVWCANDADSSDGHHRFV